MMVLIWANNRSKWIKQDKWLKDPKNAGKKVSNEGGKWTSVDDGQSEYCAWDPKGLEKYVEYLEEIEEARASPEYLATEKKCLHQLRVKHKLVCDDAKGDKKKKHREKRLLAAQKPITEVKVHRVVSTFRQKKKQKLNK